MSASLRSRVSRAAVAGCIAQALAVVWAGPSWAVTSSVYVPTQSGNSVSQYDIAVNGTLAAKPAGSATAGNSFDVAVSPDGRHAYVTGGSGSLFQYDVGPGGALAAKTPTSVTIPSGAKGIAVSPDGRSVYVASGTGLAGTVSQFDVGSDGALAPKTPPTVPAGAGAWGVAISPDGDSVYVTNNLATNLSQYDVGAGGTLSAKTAATVATGTMPEYIALSPDGQNAYVANFGSDTVSQYDVGTGGALTPKSAATVAVGDGPVTPAVSPSGGTVYVTHFNGHALLGYNVAADGALTLISEAGDACPGTGCVPPNGQPWGVAVSPDGQSVYVANSGTSNVSRHGVSASGLPQPPATVASDPAPRGLAVMPNQPPVASFVASPATAGSASGFDASSSTDADGSLARYDWEFGDGTALPNGGPTPSHTYGTAGDYTVTLTLTDDSGCSDALVFTGQTAHCNGGPGAVTSRVVTVPAALDPPATSGPQSTLVAPSLRILTRRVTATKKGVVAMRLACANADCRGTLSLTATVKERKRKRTVRLGSKTFSVATGQSASVSIRLSKANLKLLKRMRRLSARATATPAGGAAAATTVRIAATKR